jgi:hypothetical protein
MVFRYNKNMNQTFKLVAALLTVAAFTAVAQSQSITKGTVTYTVTESSYPDAAGVQQLPLTSILACTVDSRTVGFSMVVNFPQASAVPQVITLLRPVPGNWALCGIAIVANPKSAITSVMVSELQPNPQEFVAVRGN